MPASHPRESPLVGRLAALRDLDDLAMLARDEPSGMLASGHDERAHMAARWMLGALHDTGVSLVGDRTSRLAQLLSQLVTADRSARGE